MIVNKTDDGYTAEIPSIHGCECWAHDEDSAINEILNLAGFYLNLDSKEIKLDRARKYRNRIVYKLVFHKEV